MHYLTRTVWILSLVSFFTDMASEMLYPVMPLYLKTIGFSVLLIGVLEGFAEATTGFSKGYFGKFSDTSGKRLPFIQLGYFLSAVSKPLMVASIIPLWVFVVRSLDRLGKGIRTGARDAMLSDETTLENKGKVFGFHRSMDTMGAVAGPTLAMLYLYFYPAHYTVLFYLAFIPGLLAVASTLFLKDRIPDKKDQTIRPGFFSFLGYWKTSPVAYKKLVPAFLVFTLFNSSDVFLLLKAREAGMDDAWVIGLYIFYNLVYAIFAFPLGIWADKIGLNKMYFIGLLFFALTYTGMAFNDSTLGFFVLFLCYGIYSAATEGISKAWISNLVDKRDTATAIGTYSAFQSLAMMLASSFAGFIWFVTDRPTYTFLLSASIAMLVAIYVALISPDLKK